MEKSKKNSVATARQKERRRFLCMKTEKNIFELLNNVEPIENIYSRTFYPRHQPISGLFDLNLSIATPSMRLFFLCIRFNAAKYQ